MPVSTWALPSNPTSGDPPPALASVMESVGRRVRRRLSFMTKKPRSSSPLSESAVARGLVPSAWSSWNYAGSGMEVIAIHGAPRTGDKPPYY
jgi:hypothetical protein